jgi:hypothetical protein
MDTKYIEKYIETDKFKNVKQDYSSFQEHINNKDNINKYAISFYNLDKSCILVIPVPQQDKNFTHIKDFMDNAEPKQQKEFWKFAAIQIKKRLKTQDTVYINTHGLGIPYFHLRIDNTPKYYVSNDLKN